MSDATGGRYGGPNPVGGGADPQKQPAPFEPPPSMHPGPWQPPNAVPAPGPQASGVDPSRLPLLPIRKSRKRLWSTVAALGAVVVSAVVAVIVFTGHDTTSVASPADVVKGYLDALARGDADAALSYSDKRPASNDYLTPDILKKQIAKWPITNIRILNANSSDAATGRVHAASTFGTTISETTMHLTRQKGRWRLEEAAIALPPNPLPDASEQTLTLFGKPFGQSRQYVFPGWLDVASGNHYISATTKPLLLDRLTQREHYLQADYAINDTGEKAVIDVTVAEFAKCEQSHSLKPPYPCSEVGLPADKFVDGTVTWGEANLGELNSTFDQKRLAINFFGRITNDVTAQTTSGTSDHFTAQHNVKGIAELSTVSPTLKFG
jgi:hypothetical protein